MIANEKHDIPDEYFPPFDIVVPDDQWTPFVFCSPHSGRIYPERFLALSRLSPLALRKSEDSYVDQLFSGVASQGAPLISARFPRAYLDLNREPYELDQELFQQPLPDYANSRSVRVAGGLGTIARIVADGEEIYHGPLPLQAALDRIARLYFPFHEALTGLVKDTRRRFGYAVLFDCHSMPSASMAPGGGRRPDIVLGDRFGAACDGRISRAVRDILVNRGYEVEMNRPYAGGYITESHGRPNRGTSALQIEINRGLYLDERTMSPKPGFDDLRHDLMGMVTELIAEIPGLLDRPAAAE